jgi:dTDP-4-amino-4,6-dideoxygalactose transaminase
MSIPFVDLAAQYASIRTEIDAAVSAVIAENAFIGGRFVRAFEEDFAAFLGAGECVGCANGTDAIEIALETLSLPPESEIIVPANTFIATSEAVTRAGHRVVFCDCDPQSYTLSIEDAGRRITSGTQAIIPVHLYGQPCDMEAVLSLANAHGLRVIEDCAQAHGAFYKGQKVGTLGDIGTFSFYPGKNLGAYGDAGAIVTNDKDLAKRCRMVANHGRTDKYNHIFEGRNSRLDGMQAAVLSVKLRHLDQWTAARRRHAGAYRALLEEAAMVVPAELPDAEHVYHLYVIQVNDREKIRGALHAAGIGCGIHYPVPLPLLEAYRHLGMKAEDFPVAAYLKDRVLSLPMFPELTEVQIASIAGVVRETCAGAAG